MVYNLEHVYLTTEQRMREIRNALLFDSDWTQLPDAVCDREKWAEYRQSLRDFPTRWNPGLTAEFPETP